MRVVKPSQLHLTLKFIGEISESVINDSIEALKTIDYPSFQLEFADLGVFPNIKRIRVLWMGINEGKQDLISLSKIANDKLKSVGIPIDKRSYSPHLTLARIKFFEKATTNFIVDEINNSRNVPFLFTSILPSEYMRVNPNTNCTAVPYIIFPLKWTGVIDIAMRYKELSIS